MAGIGGFLKRRRLARSVQIPQACVEPRAVSLSESPPEPIGTNNLAEERMRPTRRSVNLGLVASLAAPSFSRLARAEGETIKIGMVLPVTGPAADSGKYALAGARIALDRVNKSGGVLGKPIELVTEDDQTTNPGAVLAFSKLAAQADIVAFLGSIRSTQNHAMAADILKTGKPVCFGGTDPALTKMGNPWLIRFRPNDSYSGRVIASYGVETLGKKNWAIVHSTDAFGTGGLKALSAALDKAGAKVAIDQGYPNQNQDFTPVVLAIKSSGADIIGSYFTFDNDIAIFARQLRQLGVALPWVGSPSIIVAGALGHLRGRRLRHRFEPRGAGIREALRCRIECSGGQLQLLDLRRYRRSQRRHQQGRLHRPRQGPRCDPVDQGLQGRRGRI
jgi:ABC-type branched-subunit amino acid transport system substrate-binding protein